MPNRLPKVINRDEAERGDMLCTLTQTVGPT